MYIFLIDSYKSIQNLLPTKDPLIIVKETKINQKKDFKKNE